MARNVLRPLTKYAGYLWTLCRSRKQHKCCECRDELMKGTMVYRPMTNDYKRMIRMCIHCMGAVGKTLHDMS